MKALFTTLTLSLVALTLWAQQPAQYSLYMLDPFRINPAYAGLEDALVFTGAIRQQWTDLDGAPSGQRVSGHLPFYFLSGGFGVQFENDRIGPNQLTNLQLAYNYQLDLDNAILSIGAGAGLQSWRLNGNELQTPSGTYEPGFTFNHNDPFLSALEESGNGLQFSVGAFYRSERLDVGISAENITATPIELSETTYQTERVYNAFVRANFEVGRRFLLQPSALFRTDGIEQQTDISVLVKYNDNIFAGASFRGYNATTQDAIAALFGFNLSANIQLAYAYDIGLSNLRTVHNGSHELVIRYRINQTIGAGVPPRIIYHPRAKGRS
ncbi:MAG: type IX secretion system membrane protein PorP/SprF [Bacteroidota bacterium]